MLRNGIGYYFINVWSNRRQRLNWYIRIEAEQFLLVYGPVCFCLLFDVNTWNAKNEQSFIF